MKNVLNQSLCIELHTNVVFFIRYHTIIWFTTVSEFAFFKNGYLTEKKCRSYLREYAVPNLADLCRCRCLLHDDRGC